MSCVFSCTSDLERRSSPRSRPATWGSTGCRCCARRRSRCPGSLPRVIRVLLHYYAPGRAPAAARVPARGAVAADRSRSRRSRLHPRWPFASWKTRAHPSLRGGHRERRRRRAERGDVAMLASNESPFPPVPSRRGGGARRGRRRQPLPGPGRARAALGARRRATTIPSRAIAVGNGSCEILLAAAEALLEPWQRDRLRLAVVLDVSAPGGGHRRQGGRGAARRRTTSTTSTRCGSPITDHTRMLLVCNPNNPTSTHLPRGAHRRRSSRRCRRACS